MQIHIVEKGDTVYELAQFYNTTVSDIIRANKLENPSQLVVGQTLVIPIIGSFYTVQPGDTLFTIAEKLEINSNELAKMYRIPLNKPIYPGLELYIPPRPRTAAEINAYVEPFGDTVSPRLERAAREAAPYLTYLAPFSYKINRDGTLNAPPLDNFKFIAEINNAALMMVITNLEEGQFSRELGRIILTDEELQEKLINNIVETAKQVGFSDVHFDLEFLPPELKGAYNEFLRKAKRQISDAGLLMSTALAPKTSAEQAGAWYEAHDYAAHGEIADFVVLMTYEWGYSGGPPRAVSPLPEVTEVVKYALSEMPANKIMLGQNLYGYDWTLPFVPGGEFAEAISPQEAIRRAYEFNAAIQYDDVSQAPFIEYFDDDGKEHIIWFEDARSIQAKFDLVKELDLRGVSYWKLGLPFPQNWLLIEDNFNVIKR
ncbi:glycosyl hydrolase family 18 protein [Haloplasma contractile]|uniref:Spore germination protein YaaH n=1 Tax=Haloplasma contractile SSD-17B TaxID=1033810 RepID=U2EGV9_9MOLU|nr:glycoside hydrolase family 18 protein [Haloplasma contractile]ERJ13841.1 Spore germination protein YaaH [Haloplasma contractile SSD-17B]